MEDVGLDPAEGRGQPGAEVQLQARPGAAEPGDLDRAVGLDGRRPRLVIHAEDLDDRPELCLGAGQSPHVGLDPAGGRRVIFPQVADLQRFHGLGRFHEIRFRPRGTGIS